MTVLIEARDLTKHFPVRTGGLLRRRTTPLRAVEAVSLSVRAGETLGLVGELGCGKSTLGRMLINLIRATSGSIHFDGTEITTLPARGMRELRKAMQIIFQDPVRRAEPAHDGRGHRRRTARHPWREGQRRTAVPGCVHAVACRPAGAGDRSVPA